MTSTIELGLWSRLQARWPKGSGDKSGEWKNTGAKKKPPVKRAPAKKDPAKKPPVAKKPAAPRAPRATTPKSAAPSKPRTGAAGANHAAKIEARKQDMVGFKSYQGSSAIINATLREGEVPRMWRQHRIPMKELEKGLPSLDAAFSSGHYVTQADYKVFRGLQNGVGDNIKEGDLFLDKAYISTSFNKSIATRFSTRFDDEQAVVMEIEVPKGTRAHYLANGSDEKELLLDRGTGIQITSTELVNGVRVIKGRVVQSART